MAAAESLTQTELSALGARLGALRAGRGWTLDELARRVSAVLDAPVPPQT